MPRIRRFSAGLLVLSMFWSAAASADTLFGLYAGAGTWEQSYSGKVSSGSSSVDVEDDLAIEDDSNNVFYIALEHPLPALPNLRGQRFSMNVDGSNVLSRNIEFNGQVFDVTEAVDTSVDLTQSDAVMYYEVLDNVVSLDLGMALTLVEGSIEIASFTGSATAEFDEVIPMLYARARADLPFTGMWLGAEAQGVSYDNNSLMEFNAQIGWESEVGFGVEAGYRGVQVELDAFDEVNAAEIDIKGPYAAINYHF